MSTTRGYHKQPQTVTQSVVGVTTTTATVVAANGERKGGFIVNVSDTTVWISFSGDAVEDECIPVFPNSSLALDINGYPVKGAIAALHGGTGTKNIVVEEI